MWQSPELYRHRWVCQFSFARESNWVQMKKAKQTLNAADFLGKSKILFGKKKQRAHPRSLFGLCALCSCRTKCWCGLALTPLYCFLPISCVSGLVTYQLYSTWKHGYGMRKTPKICIPSILQHSTLVYLSCVEADLCGTLCRNQKLLGLKKIYWNQLLSGIMFESLVPKNWIKYNVSTTCISTAWGHGWCGMA